MSSAPLLTPVRVAQFARSILALAIARAFTPPPDIPIWKFADENVILQSEDAAEPGPYRSAKTPWTRRLQELARRPFMWHFDFEKSAWVKVKLTEINVQKSTQSGFTEAILNVIRWFAKFLPRNVMYRIDAVDRAKKIARRLLRSLKWLDPSIFTGDPDDIKTTEFILRGMEMWFIGSFNPGQATQVQAGIVVNDEVEEHAESAGETSTLLDSKYRKKTHKSGLEFNIGKPKLERGPINKAWKRGNREEYHIACPSCDTLQWIGRRQEERETPFSDKLQTVTDPDTGEKIQLPKPLPLGQTRKVRPAILIYKHCRNLLGEWDQLRIQHEIYAECIKCKAKIFEQKFDEHGHCIGVGVPMAAVLDAADRDTQMLGWLPTAIGQPGIVSQHMSDLLSSDEGSFWGDIILELISAQREGPKQIQGIVNNRFGNAWSEELNDTKQDDIRANVAGRDYYFLDVQTEKGTTREVFPTIADAEASRKLFIGGGAEVSVIIPSFCKPYKRGNIPFAPSSIILGSDVGGNYARWILIAVCQNMIDAAVIDWGDELDSENIAHIILTQTWPCLADGKRRRIAYGFIDSHFNTTEILRACWHVFITAKKHIMIPVAMIGGVAARGLRVWNFHPIQGYRSRQFNHKSFKQLGYNFRESMNDTFISCIQRKQRRIWFPAEIAKPDKDLTAEERQLIEELCNDKLIEQPNGRKAWADPPPGPNHYGSALKNAITGLRFLTKKHHLVSPGSAAQTVEVTDGTDTDN